MEENKRLTREEMAELLSRKSMDDKNYTLSRLIEAMGQLENYQNRFAHSGTLEFVLYDLGIVMSEMAGMEQPLYDMRDLDKYPPIGFGQDKEQVNHPAHYKKGGKECIDAMVEKFGADAVIAFCKCNEFKYKWRAGNKDGTTEKTDLSKAKWYKRKAKALYEQAHCWHDVTEHPDGVKVCHIKYTTEESGGAEFSYVGKWTGSEWLVRTPYKNDEFEPVPDHIKITAWRS